MKVYLVTKGSYSDYRVCCVCSTMEKAEYARRLYVADDIETEELDGLPEHPHGMLRYAVTMDRDGNSTCQTESLYYTTDDEWRPYGNGTHVSFHMWASDKTHAVKIANERRAVLIATGQWQTDWYAWKEAKEEKRDLDANT